jgi:hypothetical protein
MKLFAILLSVGVVTGTVLATPPEAPTRIVIAVAEVPSGAGSTRERIQVVLDHSHNVHDEAPSAQCEDRWEGTAIAIVTLPNGTTVETPLTALFNRPFLAFCKHSGSPSPLAIADYNGEGHVHFNLGQFENSNKWEYRLFTVLSSGRVAALALPKGAIYVAAPDDPSTEQIHAVPGGFQYPDFGNCCTDEEMGWWLFTMRWNKPTGSFVVGAPQKHLRARPW